MPVNESLLIKLLCWDISIDYTSHYHLAEEAVFQSCLLLEPVSHRGTSHHVSTSDLPNWKTLFIERYLGTETRIAHSNGWAGCELLSGNRYKLCSLNESSLPQWLILGQFDVANRMIGRVVSDNPWRITAVSPLFNEPIIASVSSVLHQCKLAMFQSS